MSDACRNCGRTQSEAIVEAKTLGLEQEFLGCRYTCCQIAEWADEQAAAWLEAICDERATNDENRARHYEFVDLVELGESEEIFVRVRARRPHVPWYRNPDNLR
jgi:hypothetical protein